MTVYLAAAWALRAATRSSVGGVGGEEGGEAAAAAGEGVHDRE